jgi:hypothetical protein
MAKVSTYHKPVGIQYTLNAGEVGSGVFSCYLKDMSTSGTVKPIIVAQGFTSADATIALTSVAFDVTTGLCTVSSAAYATDCYVNIIAMFQ